MRQRFIRVPAALLAAVLLTALLPTGAFPSSHSEAPTTVRDRLADDTDLYAWVAPDAPDAVTIVGNWIPLLEATSGPNFAAFDEEVMYYVNIDNVGDALDHIRYQFRFKTTAANPNTFLYNTGVVTAFDDPDLNVRQTYTLTRYDDGVPTVLIEDAPVAPNFSGPVSMPDYAALAQSTIRTLSDGTKIFVGPRDDAFFVDLEGVFDLLSIRRVPGDKGKGVDDVAGYNCMSIALQIPKTRLTRDGLPASQTANPVMGIYDSAERFATRTMNADGTVALSGDEIQVSRLGHPLVNEVVIPLKDKDTFCRTKPTGDGAFLSYVLDPEVATLLNLIYGIPKPPTPRNDLVTVFLTGIPDLNKPLLANQVPCEMLRLNVAIPPAAAPNRFGVIAGDVAGFPNGRRLFDDVVDIELRAVAGGTALTPDFNREPANQLGDGVDANDLPYLPYFPYVAPPHNPASHRHHVEQKGAFSKASAPAGVGEGRVALRMAGRNPSSRVDLAYTLRQAGRVTLRIYDVQGRLIKTLIDQDAAAGDFVAGWDGHDETGKAMPRGVYFSKLDQQGESTQRKVVLE